MRCENLDRGINPVILDFVLLLAGIVDYICIVIEKEENLNILKDLKKIGCKNRVKIEQIRKNVQDRFGLQLADWNVIPRIKKHS